MSDKIQRDNKSLHVLVKDAIIQMIKEEEFSDNKLPAESKLAERFGVSVAVVREALLLLRRDGIVTKKQGSGNYFHRSAINGARRIDEYMGFRELLESNGYHTRDEIREFRIMEADSYLCEKLDLKEGEQVAAYTRIIYADEHPAIECHNFIPVKLFRVAPTEEMVQAPIYDVFWNCLWKEMVYGQMKFYPYLSTLEDEKQLGIAAGRPMIILEEQYYSLEDIPMAVSRNKLNDEYITVNMFSR